MLSSSYGCDTSTTTTTSISGYRLSPQHRPCPHQREFLSPYYQVGRVPPTGDSHQLDSNSSSAANYIPMNDTSLDFAAEQLALRVHSQKEYRCLCGICHVVLGTKIFLLLYVVLTMFGLIFGMVSAMVWTGIPFMVTVMTIYGFCRRKHKYFYPFLIISVVQLIVCLIMGFIIAVFSILNYDTLKLILAHNLKTEPPTTVIVTIVGATVFSCCILAILHVWQVLVIYSCLQYYEFDLRPDRGLISTHLDATGHDQAASYFDNSHKPIPELPAEALASFSQDIRRSEALI